MKINVLRKTKYQDTYVYVMQFGTIFQYLFAWHGEINMDRLDLKPKWWRWIVYWLRLLPLYNAQQLEEGEEIILSGALGRIDKIIAEGGRDRPARRQEHRQKNKECLWQTRVARVKKGKEVEEEGYWICLTHGEAVKMEDGVKPSHK